VPRRPDYEYRVIAPVAARARIAFRVHARTTDGAWADRGVLAVEMQAASLFAFARAREAQVAMVALVRNSIDQVTGDFDTGGHKFRTDVLSAVVRAALAFVSSGAGTN
jgi:uridine phosphorylase